MVNGEELIHVKAKLPDQRENETQSHEKDTHTINHNKSQKIKTKITAQTRSVLGRTYAHLLGDSDITQLNNTITPLRYNQSKGLIGRPSDKITWPTTLLGHTDVPQAYKECLLEKDQEESSLPTNTDQLNKREVSHPETRPKAHT